MNTYNYVDRGNERNGFRSKINTFAYSLVLYGTCKFIGLRYGQSSPGSGHKPLK